MSQTIARPAEASAQANPLRAGLSTNRIAEPCNVIFFGASGDLMKRMLMPAMYNLRLGDVLPMNYGIVGFSRTEWEDDGFRSAMKASVDEFSRSGEAKDPLWSDFAKHLSYVSGDFDDVKCYKRLKERLDRNDKELGTKHNRLFYLSTPPGLFAKIVDMLEQAGLAPDDNKEGWTRIIVEKPF
ncbi:MAG: glucose-6-phosphate dehydrogenase, partial [Vulcanimicrobiaceae bacterium]